MKVALDLDDVILDFTGGVRAAVQREFDVEIPEFSAWDIAPILNPILGQPWMKWMRSRSWLWSTFPAVRGAVGTVELLRRDGHYLEIVTSKPEWAEASVWDWLGKWRLPVQSVRIIGPEDRKVDFTDAAVLVDDKPRNCVEFLEDRRAAILFDRSHNQTAKLARAYSWADVRSMVNELESGL